MASALADVVKGSVMTLSLFAAYITFPVVGVVAGCVSPLPVLYYSLAGGAVRGALIVVLSAVMVYGYGGLAAAVMYLVQAGIMALVLSYGIARGQSLSRSIAAATVCCAVLAVLVAAAYGSFAGVSLNGQVLEGIRLSTDQALDVYAKSGVTGDELASLKNGMAQVAKVLSELYPSLLLIFLGAVAAVNALAMKVLGAKRGIKLPGADFMSFRLPDMLVWLVITAGFSLFVPSGEVRFAAHNLLMTLGALYFVQGLAIVAALFKRIALPAFAKIIFYLLLGIQPYLLIAVAVLGLFDIWGNFRVPRQKNL